MLINGSPREFGCTFTALSEVASVLNEESVETEIFQAGKDVRGCIACYRCSEGRCALPDDIVHAAREKALNADGFVFGSPVYYAAASAQITALLNRLFFSGSGAFKNKPGAAVVSCRRAGSTAALEQLNKYLIISQMLLVGSQYWPMVHGNNPDEVRRDLEGMQTMRVLGRNLAWVLKSIDAGRAAGISLPHQEEKRFRTNFIEPNRE